MIRILDVELCLCPRCIAKGAATLAVGLFCIFGLPWAVLILGMAGTGK